MYQKFAFVLFVGISVCVFILIFIQILQPSVSSQEILNQSSHPLNHTISSRILWIMVSN